MGSVMSPDRRLRVLHVGLRPDAGRGNGVDVAAWPLLAAQVRAGAEITLLVLGGELDQGGRAEAARAGVTVVPAAGGFRGSLSPEGAAAVERIRPDVGHLHSVFIPAHAQIARRLRRLEIPYLLSPHGGLNLWRGRLKKAVYGALAEKSFFTAADTIFVLTPQERETVVGWLGRRDRQPRYVELPNSIPALAAPGALWGVPGQQRLVYLGRFDVFKKGLDRLVEIARLLPDVQVAAYGTASSAERPGFERLCRAGLPGNFAFLDPVYGEAKLSALTSATIYVQPSRDEGFGMAIVEAMRCGVPVALTEDCALAPVIARRDLGLPLPGDPVGAAAVLSAVLKDSDRLNRWSQAGREWTARDLSPERVAQTALSAYQAAVARGVPVRV
jgi:glycosyltransferase involved in cell wall biosynthesis